MSSIPVTLAGVSEMRAKQAEAERSSSMRRPSKPDFLEPKRDMAPSNFESVAELHSFLERRSRQWGMTIRLLEQQRQYLRSMEIQREDTYKRLAEVMETVVDTARMVKSATDKDTKQTGELENLFERNRKALEQMENISVSLSTNFVCWRSAWEQYSQTCEKAKLLRDEMAASNPMTDA